MKVTLKEVKEIAKGKLLLIFDLQGQALPFTAGQFCSLVLLNPPYTDNRGDKRYLGFVNSPSEKETISFLTKTGPSAYKKSLLEMKPGTEAEIMNIEGHIHLPEEKSKPLVFFAGGIGLAPVMSVIRFVHEQAWSYKITLMYVNETIDETAFFEELQTLAKDNPNFTFIPVFSAEPNWSGEKRTIDTQFIKDYLPNPNENIYFITGEPKFSPAVVRVLREIGIPPQQITMEIFTGY